MAELQTSSGLSLFNWWYQPITEWQKTFLNMIHLEKTVAQMQTVDTTTTQTQQVFVGRNKEDHALEQEILNGVGSYGLQLGKIMDVLNVLIAELKDLNPEQQAIIADFRTVRGDINKILADKRGPKPKDLTVGYCLRLVSALSQKEDEERYRLARELRKMLKQFTNGDDGLPPSGRLAGTGDGPAVGKKR